MKPILFNTEMVKAILDGRKTVTRRKIDIDIINHCDIDTDGALLDYQNSYGDFINPVDLCRYRAGDILYVRETWQLLPSGFDEIPPEMNYIYKASDELSDECTRWRPSLHMPKEAARIFLRVKEVRVEMMCEMLTIDFLNEGIELYKSGLTEKSEIEIEYEFEDLWNSTVKKADLERYGWDANPWVWVIEFERIGKDEALSN